MLNLIYRDELPDEFDEEEFSTPPQLPAIETLDMSTTRRTIMHTSRADTTVTGSSPTANPVTAKTIRQSSTFNKQTVDEHLPYARDDEPFLELIEKRYNDSQLFEWEPAVSLPHDPNEPGYMGNFPFQFKSSERIAQLVSLNLSGQPFVVPAERQQEAKERFDLHQFNIVASEMISLNRTYPDMRNQS